jgi:hypothetical protein
VPITSSNISSNLCLSAAPNPTVALLTHSKQLILALIGVIVILLCMGDSSNGLICGLRIKGETIDGLNLSKFVGIFTGFDVFSLATGAVGVYSTSNSSLSKSIRQLLYLILEGYCSEWMRSGGIGAELSLRYLISSMLWGLLC